MTALAQLLTLLRLIRRRSKGNPLWGAPHVRNELATFLRNHLGVTAA